MLTQSGEEDEREGVISRSPSLSRYSSSFSSESSQDSGGEGGERRESVDSPYLLPESKRSAVLNETQRGDVDESLNNGVDTSTDPVLDAEETNSAKQDGGQDATTAEARPELVTRGGVRIVYKLGPVPTSEHGTQTNNEVPANEPECGTQTNAKAPETGAQVEEQPTADATERGTQNDEQATPETGDQTTADTPALGTQTDEQPLESAAAPEHGKLTDQQTTPGTESLVVDSNPAHTTLASTDEREEKEDRQMKEEDKEPEQKYDEQKANPDPSTINESVVGSTQSSQLPVSEIQLGKDNESTPPTYKEGSRPSQPSPPNTPSKTTDTYSDDTMESNRASEGMESHTPEPTKAQQTARESRALQTAQDSLSSSEDNELPATMAEDDGELDSVSRNTLTDVSERTSISPSSSTVPPSSKTELSEFADFT